MERCCCRSVARNDLPRHDPSILFTHTADTAMTGSSPPSPPPSPATASHDDANAPLSEEEIIRQVGARTRYYYADGQFSCAEAMIKAFAEVFAPHRVDSRLITRLATPFNGGFSELQHTCGVLTAGLMSIGLVTGRDQPGDEEAKEQAYTLTQIYHRRYMDAVGTDSCRELLQRWKEQGVEKSLCKAHAQRMSELLARTILQVGFHDLSTDEEE
ncbi:MAG: C_GCAxxG_C_C family protein [Magnetococcales bacterium]|nr:C_GCAxxG_C_C family protein [Magnetococcales bacterium]